MSKRMPTIAPNCRRGRFREAAVRAIHPFRIFEFWVLIALFIISAVPTVHAQDEHRRTKVPLIGKIGGGTNRQAFSGKVQAVDTKRKLLVVDAVEGSYTEYFPVKGSFEVTAPGGKKTRVSDLTPGTNIIIYYEVKDDRRSVTAILVLGSKTPEKETKETETKKPAAPS